MKIDQYPEKKSLSLNKEKAASVQETVHDFLRHQSRELDVFFTPNTVAVIGATDAEGSVGRTVLSNLIRNPFGGTVIPVNPKRTNVMGIKAYASIKDFKAPVDLAVVLTPPASVPQVMKDCVASGVKGCIIISAGFKETGAAGAELEKEVLEIARKGRIRIIGPNCLGVMNPYTGFNATFSLTPAKPGGVAFISQSGAILTAVLDWSAQQKAGFSAIVSVGSMLDVGWGDLIDYLGDDPKTKSIVAYMETVGDARAFLSAAREVALNKPIIVIKPGRTEGAAKAAASHTGSLSGSDDVIDAAFHRCGVLRVHRISDLFHMAEVLGKQPRPKGPRLAIVTNAGGPAVIATDALIQSGGELAPLKKETIDELNQFLPAAWSHANPIDILGDAGPDRYTKTLRLISEDPTNDGLLVILTPQAMTDPTKTAESLKLMNIKNGKPIFVSWMGGESIQKGLEHLREAAMPEFSYPDTAAQAFVSMWRYSENLKELYETPSPASIADESLDRNQKMKEIVEEMRRSNRTLLTELESKHVLAVYGIPTVATHMAHSEKQAVSWAEKIGFPVVLKIHSKTITHKTDVKGVALDLRTPTAVRKAFRSIRNNMIDRFGNKSFEGVTVQPMVKREGYELIIGSSIDPQFGPVLLFGSGGQLVEIYKDRVLGLPPLNTTLARRMIERTKIFHAFKGVRGRAPVDIKGLEQILVRFSQLVAENPRIKEIDINPLLASPDSFCALDARVIFHEWKLKDDELPPSAIRPYPAQYVKKDRLKDGSPVTLRPIRHQDEPLLVKFHESLSERSVYLRYFQSLKIDQRVTHERLLRRCFIDYRREIALVIEKKGPLNESVLLGIGRLVKSRYEVGEAEFAVVIADPFQRQGLGFKLLQRLLEVARAENIKSVGADMLRENYAMLKICKVLGFQIEDKGDQAVIRVTRDVQGKSNGQ